MREHDRFAEIEQAKLEVSSESFDRMAFAEHALDLVRPERTIVALCAGVFSVRVESGRQWGDASGGRWAIVSVPPRASRRAIAIAIAGLAGERRPWALDVLLGDATDGDRGAITSSAAS
jgi:hypothetical protein